MKPAGRWLAAGLITMIGIGVTQTSAAGAQEPSAEEARARAEQILSENKYRDDGGPINRPVREVERWFDRNPTTTQYRPPQSGGKPKPPPKPPKAIGSLEGLGPILAGVLIAALVTVIGLLAFFVIRSLRRRDARDRSKRKDPKRGTRQPVAAAELLDPDIAGIRMPDQIEALAAEAEAAGDFSRAVRLRFRAGLLRLDDASVLPFDPSLTTGQLMRTLRNSTFDGLALTFDRVVYGEVAATATEAGAARHDWPTVVRETQSARTVATGSIR
jgi:hypothetical protein